MPPYRTWMMSTRFPKCSCIPSEVALPRSNKNCFAVFEIHIEQSTSRIPRRTGVCVCVCDSELWTTSYHVRVDAPVPKCLPHSPAANPTPPFLPEVPHLINVVNCIPLKYGTPMSALRPVGGDHTDPASLNCLRRGCFLTSHVVPECQYCVPRRRRGPNSLIDSA